jgi:hypothetical protein
MQISFIPKFCGKIYSNLFSIFIQLKIIPPFIQGVKVHKMVGTEKRYRSSNTNNPKLGFRTPNQQLEKGARRPNQIGQSKFILFIILDVFVGSRAKLEKQENFNDPLTIWRTYSTPKKIRIISIHFHCEFFVKFHHFPQSFLLPSQFCICPFWVPPFTFNPPLLFHFFWPIL